MSLLGSLFKDRFAKKPAAKPPEKPPKKEERKTTRAAAPEPPRFAPPVEQRPAEPEAAAAPDLDAIREQLKEIEQIIGAGESTPSVGSMGDDVVALEVPLKDVVDVLPPAYVRTGGPDADAQSRVTIIVPDLFNQLAKGKVVTTIERLIAEVPESHLATDIQQHLSEDISLPLPLVVSAIRPDELQKRTTATQRDIAVTDLPNLFAREGEPVQKKPAAKPAEAARPAPKKKVPPAPVEEPARVAAAAVVEKVAPPPPAPKIVKPAPEPEPVVAAVPELAPPPPVEEEPAPLAEEVIPPIAAAAPPEAEEEEVPAEAEPEPEPVEAPVEEAAPAPVFEEPAPVAEEPAVVETVAAPVEAEPVMAAAKAVPAYEEVVEGSYLFLRGTDMNKATAAELVERFDGIGPKMARKIVEDREINGPFFYLLDLARVPGLGRKTFENITGLPLRKQIFAYLGIVGQVLGKSLDGVPDVRQVAVQFKNIEGFEGCILAHEDGYVLAHSWEEQRSDAFGAFAPQMYKKMGQYLRRLDLGGVGSITFFLEDHPFTLVRSGDIFLVAVHKADRFSRKHVHIVQAIGAELGRRLLRRQIAAGVKPRTDEDDV